LLNRRPAVLMRRNWSLEIVHVSGTYEYKRTLHTTTQVKVKPHRRLAPDSRHPAAAIASHQVAATPTIRSVQEKEINDARAKRDDARSGGLQLRGKTYLMTCTMRLSATRL